MWHQLATVAAIAVGPSLLVIEAVVENIHPLASIHRLYGAEAAMLL